MHTTPSGWQVLDEDRALLVREYSIGPGNSSNCTVARCGEGELMVLSPSGTIDDDALRELEDFGEVVALVAPNGLHRAGLPAWSAAFPQATVHAPERALPRVRKVAPEARPLSELAGAAPEGVALLDALLAGDDDSVGKP